MIELGKRYRPIEGDVSGEVLEIADNKVHWQHKDTVFIIPVERFSEYFCKEDDRDDGSGADRQDLERDSTR